MQENNRDIARKLLKRSMPIPDILEITQLTKEELQEIIQEQ